MTLAQPTTLPARRSEFQVRHPGRRMTEEEFVGWIAEKTRAEWIDGHIIMMAPVSLIEDDVSFWLRTLVQVFVDHHELGTVCGSGVVVRLPNLKQRRLPDISFVTSERAEIVLPNHIDGPPDLVMEIVSPDSIDRDWRDKFRDYERAKVKKYWVIDPLSKRLEAYTLSRAGKYRRIAEKETGFPSIVIPGFRLKSQWLFSGALPNLLGVLKELGIA